MTAGKTVPKDAAPDLNVSERDKLGVVLRRIGWLQERVSSRHAGAFYDRAEMGALRWLLQRADLPELVETGVGQEPPGPSPANPPAGGAPDPRVKFRQPERDATLEARECRHTPESLAYQQATRELSNTVAERLDDAGVPRAVEAGPLTLLGRVSILLDLYEFEGEGERDVA